MAKRQLVITQLYPNQMNIYGDNGNAQIIRRRAELCGYQTKMMAYNSYDDIDALTQADLILGGGGQDSGQRAILKDLQRIRPTLLSLAEGKVPMLMICGLYQLFGYYFTTRDGDKLDGIGLFDMVTIGGNRRLIGNAVVDSEEFGKLIGYENHSGITTLGDNQANLGQVIQGYGNDGNGVDEGAVRYAAVGTYLHGPVLSKNPRLADWLILRATERKFGKTKLTPADETAQAELAKLDRFIDRARTVAKSRPQ